MRNCYEVSKSLKAAATRERKHKLLSALAHKEEQDLMGMSKEQIEKEIAQLGA